MTLTEHNDLFYKQLCAEWKEFFMTDKGHEALDRAQKAMHWLCRLSNASKRAREAREENDTESVRRDR